MHAKPQVLVLGGGFAALEAAFLLRMRLDEQVGIRLVSDSDDFVFRPNSIYVPFGADPASLLTGLSRPLARRHISFERGAVGEVDPADAFPPPPRRRTCPRNGGQPLPITRTRSGGRARAAPQPLVRDPVEAEQALAWARKHPVSVEDPAPLVIDNPNDGRG